MRAESVGATVSLDGFTVDVGAELIYGSRLDCIDCIDCINAGLVLRDHNDSREFIFA
jgi:hypothetical protein